MISPPERAVSIRPAGKDDAVEWERLRSALWPDAPAAEHGDEIASILGASHDRSTAFVACDAGGRAIGFAEASVRTDPVNGCETSPVAFLEGIYVEPHSRRGGVARLLYDAVEAWARTRGCVEIGSDADAENADGHALHAALGFAETERVIFFRKDL